MTVGQENLWSQTAFSRSDKSTVLSPWFGTVLGFVAFAIAYSFAFRFGTSFGPALASPFWFPDAILLCALLKSRRELWWIFILGTLPIRLYYGATIGLPTWFLLASFANDSAQVLVTALLLRRFMRNPLRFEGVRDFAIFVAIAVALLPAVAAFGGAAARQAMGGDYWSAWLQWFMGDALAQLVVTPAILYWVFATPWRVKNARRASKWLKPRCWRLGWSRRPIGPSWEEGPSASPKPESSCRSSSCFGRLFDSG